MRFAVLILAALVFVADPVQAHTWTEWKAEHPLKTTLTAAPTDPETRREVADYAHRRLSRNRQAERRRQDFVEAKEQWQALAQREPSVPSYSVPPTPRYDGPINWLAIADCESGDGDGQPPYRPNWSYNGSSGYDGGLQFLPSTWIGAGGGRYAPYAYQATASQQIAIASTLALRNWPYCQRYA